MCHSEVHSTTTAECMHASAYVCVCTMQRIYIWPEGEAGPTLVLASVRARARPHTHACACVRRGSVVPAVLLFGTAHRVNPGQCVVKKPYGETTATRASARRSGKKRGGEKGEGARGMAGGKGGGKRATQMCTGVTCTHACMHACMHARAHARARAGNAFAMRTTVERLCPLPNQAAPARRGSLALGARASFTRDVNFQYSFRSFRDDEE